MKIIVQDIDKTFLSILVSQDVFKHSAAAQNHESSRCYW